MAAVGVKMHFRGDLRLFEREIIEQGVLHPHRIVCWHEYHRKGKPKHWEDHDTPEQPASHWHALEQRGLARVRQVLGIDPEEPSAPLGVHGRGSRRTLQDYQLYAGLHHRLQGVQDYTLQRRSPPNPNPYRSEAQWLRSLRYAGPGR